MTAEPLDEVPPEEEAPVAPVWHYTATVDDATGEVLTVARQLCDPRYPPPSPALAEGHSSLAITEAEYEVALSRQHRLVDGRLQPYTPAIPLSQVRAWAVAKVDDEAERARRRFLTPGAGQALEYRSTLDEARGLSAGVLDPADYPFLAAEQEALAAVGVVKTLREVADGVLAAEAAWAAAGAAIKRLRREAKLRIAAATSQAEIEAAVSGIGWPAP